MKQRIVQLPITQLTEAFSFLTSLLACLKDELVVTGLGGTLQSGIDVPQAQKRAWRQFVWEARGWKWWCSPSNTHIL